MTPEVTVRPIRNDDDLTFALREIDSLMAAEEGSAEAARLEVLATLVEAYEAKHYPLPFDVDPIEAIEHAAEQRGLTRKGLEPYLGSRQRVSEVLSGKRGLSISMIKKLHAGLAIPLEVLIKAGDDERPRSKKTAA